MRPLLLLLVVAQACATTRPPSPIPDPPAEPDLERLLPPPEPPPEIPAHIPRYDDTRVRKGGCPGLPAGILVSPATYAEIAYALADGRRLAAETNALRTLRIEERAAWLELEQACRARAADLEAALASERRMLTWRVAGAMLVGGLMAFVAGTLAASRKATP